MLPKTTVVGLSFSVIDSYVLFHILNMNFKLIAHAVGCCIFKLLFS